MFTVCHAVIPILGSIPGLATYPNVLKYWDTKWKIHYFKVSQNLGRLQPFETNGKLTALSVPILKHFRILSFLLPLFQEGQLSVTGESMCTKYWLTA